MIANSLEISVFRHPDEIPIDVQQLFDLSELTSFEFGTSWYRNLVNTVFPTHNGVRIYVLRKMGRAVAVLPLLATSANTSQSVESLSNYYTSIYSPLFAEGLHVNDLVHLLAAVRDAHTPMKSFRFAPMDRESDDYRLLLEALNRSGMVPFGFYCFGNWCHQVNEGWSEYLSNRDGSIRSTIKRMSKKFSSAGGTLELVCDGSNVERGIAAYERVYALSWKVAEPYPIFVPGLIRTCADRGWLRLGVAWLNGAPIAAQLWIVANGKANIYKLAYDESHKSFASGTLLTAMLMEQVIENDRVKEIDYLIGDDPYKKSWMSHRRERWGIIAYNPRTLNGICGLSKEWGSRAMKLVFERALFYYSAFRNC